MDVNLKLGSLLSDVQSKSGRAMPKTIVTDQSNLAQLAALAEGTARDKASELREALRERIW